jgi:hypothetical protein
MDKQIFIFRLNEENEGMLILVNSWRLDSEHCVLDPACCFLFICLGDLLCKSEKSEDS